MTEVTKIWKYDIPSKNLVVNVNILMYIAVIFSLNSIQKFIFKKPHSGFITHPFYIPFVYVIDIIYLSILTSFSVILV